MGRERREGLHEHNVEGSDAGFSDLNMLGSPLDLGHFFCDGMQQRSREGTPGSQEFSLATPRSTEGGAPGIGVGGLPGTPADAGLGSGGMRLPQLKEEEAEDTTRTDLLLSYCDDLGTESADNRPELTARKSDVVQIPAGTSDHQGNQMRSVRAHAPRVRARTQACCAHAGLLRTRIYNTLYTHKHTHTNTHTHTHTHTHT
jgi:hypothetical protein